MSRLTTSVATIVLLTAFCRPTVAENAPTLSEVMADDATLYDMAWTSHEHGCAVGDRGVVLITKDRGEHWRAAETPTEAPLYSISFIDDQVGWAVGGETRPYTHTTESVVLQTRDGGQTWQSVLKSPLPALKAVRFFDRKHGVAAGIGSDLYPSGLFETTDGGQSWRPLPGSRPQAWTSADLHRTREGALIGALVGARGVTAMIAGREVRESTGVSDARGRYAVQMTDPTTGWLVGDGGLVRVTRDGGKTWRTPPIEPPAELADWFDWRGIEVRGPHVWIVGSPGSVVLHSHDGGGSWNLSKTPCPTPLRNIKFLDDRQGWAVGELGVVLHTTDGGQTWRAQRGGDLRMALAWILGSPNVFPAELLGINAAGEGRRSVVTSLFSSEHQLASDSERRRLQEAAVACGASSLDADWRLPLEPDDLGLSADALKRLLDQRTDGRASQLLAQRLARMMWTYRPSVIVMNEISAISDSAGLDELLQEAVQSALALTKTAPPGFTELAAWQPERVTLINPASSSANHNGQRVATGDFSSRLGATPAQWARHSRSLLSKEHIAAPPTYHWRTIAGAPGPASRHGDLAAGIDLRAHGKAVRRSFLPVQGRLEELKRLAQKQRNMERLMQLVEGDPSWAGQVIDLTGGLEAEAGAALLLQLAEGYRETGRIDMAADTLYLLARRYPESPSADASLLWLIRHYASGERAHITARSAALRTRAKDTLSNITNSGPRFAPPPQAAPEVELTAEERFERAGALCDYLNSARPSLYADPSLRFAAAAAQRSRGFVKDAKRSALLLSKQTIAESWRRAAMAERWLSKPDGLPPEKPIVMCRQTPRRPKLDGQLKEDCWSQAESIELTGESGEPEAIIRLVRDEQFLYLAIEAYVSDNKASIDSSAKRQRDASLTEHDRVRLRIDIDRDYATAYELTVDHRGWSHDTLWGDRHWNPQWYIAAASSEEDGLSSWCVEAAIALEELVASEQLNRAAWAISAERLRPGERTATWRGATSQSDSPDAFGLLLFD